MKGISSGNNDDDGSNDCNERKNDERSFSPLQVVQQRQGQQTRSMTRQRKCPKQPNVTNENNLG